MLTRLIRTVHPSVIALAGLAAMVCALAAPASATPPSGPGGCQVAAPASGGASVSAAPGTVIPDNGTYIVSTLSVAGIASRTWDVDLVTRIRHQGSGDLEILLRSPSGTEATISTGNGGGDENIFNGTRWDDQARDPITDASTTNATVLARIAPEEPLAVFAGEDPNGTWSLLIRDRENGRTGTLDGWSLDISTVSAPVINTDTAATSAESKLVPAVGNVESSVTIAGASGPVVDLTVLTRIRHSRSSDLRISLRSPAGTVVLLTTSNGSSNADVYNGTRWDDQAGKLVPPGPPISDATFSASTPVALAAPQGPFAAFAGEDPNGTWTLLVSDTRLNQDGGALVGWSLDLSTASCRADLAVQTRTSPERPIAGGRVTLTASVANVGPDVASGTVLSVGLPADARILSATGQGASCRVGASTTCDLGRLAPGGRREVVLVFVPPSGGGQLVAPVRASARELDANPTDNDAAAAIRILPNTPTPVARGLQLFGRVAVWPSARFRFVLSRAATLDVTLSTARGAKPFARTVVSGRKGENRLPITRITERRLRAGTYTLRVRPRGVTPTKTVRLTFKVGPAG